MSHSSLPQPGRRYHDRLQQAGRWLREPTAIAAIASLGIHGALAAGLPLLPPAKPPDPDHQSVSLVQLSPLEQLRLPQPTAAFTLPNAKNTVPLATSPYQLPQVGNSFTDDTLAGGTIEVPGTPSDSVGFSDENYRKRLLELLDARAKAQEDAKKPSPQPSPTQSSEKPGTQPSPTQAPTNAPTNAPTQAPTNAPTGNPGSPNAASPPKLSSAQEHVRDLQRQRRGVKGNAAPGAPTRAGDAAGSLGQFIAQIDRLATAKGSELEIPQAPQPLAVACPATANCDQIAQKLSVQPAITIAVDPEGKVIQATDAQGKAIMLMTQVKTGDPAIDAAVQQALTPVIARFPATGKYQIYQFRMQLLGSSEANQR